ncbi:MAG: hypothetical protein U1A77_19365 [Pirellulales bacterium]
MARQEVDREDLLREATALVERIEIEVDSWPDPVVVGFRRGGEGSVYFGADPVYQFNLHSELRRGYLRGRLIKAERRCLVIMDRQRSETEVALIRTPLDAAASQELLANARRHLSELLTRMEAGDFREIGRVPKDANVLARVVGWLKTLPDPLSAADAPNVAVRAAGRKKTTSRPTSG